MNDQKKRKFKGSVLFTVVFVMSILIVLLFGTLTLAYATNSRSHVNYSSAQTGITSRLVTESAIKAISGNEDYAKAIADLNASSAPLNVKIGLSSDNSDAALGTMGHGEDSHDIYAEIAYAGKKEYYDVDKKTWQQRDLLRFTSTVSQGGVDKTSTAYVLKHFKKDNTGGSSGGAGFVTTAGAVFDCQTSLYGGSYVNLPDWDNDAIFAAYKTSDADELKFYEELSSLSEAERGFPELNSSSLSTTSLWLNNAGGIMEADTYIYNNVVPNNWSGFYFPDKDTGITIWGDLYAPATNTRDHLKCREGESLKKYDARKAAPADLKQIDFNEIPYIYVNGKIHGGDGFAIELGNTTDPFPLNVFCGSIDTSNLTNGVGIAADIYCMDKNVTNKIGSTGTTTLYSWTASVLNGGEPSITGNYVSGTICSNSDLELTNITVNGDVRVNGKCTISGNVTIKGNIVCNELAGDFSNFGVSKTIYCGNTPVFPGENSALKYELFEQVESYKHINDGSLSPDDVSDYDNDKIVWVYNKKLYEEFILEEDYVDEDGNVQGRKGRNGENLGWITELGNPVYYEVDGDGNPTGTVTNSTGGGMYQKWTAIQTGEDEDGKFTYEQEETQERTDVAEYLYDLRYNREYEWKSRVDFDGNDTLEPTDKDYVWYRKSDGSMVSDDDVKNESSSEYLTAPVSSYGIIYPKYAERGVLLGLDPSVDKAETQVVKPLKEILKEVANPYDYSDASKIKEIKEKYEGLPTLGKSRSSTDINSSYYESVADIKTGMTNQTGITTVAGETLNMPIYINKSCVLNLSVSNGEAKALVFDPGDSEMLVVIEKLVVDSGVPIYVDDTNGGKVYFYIEGNGTEGLTHKGGGDGPILATVKFANALKDNSIVKYNSPTIADGYDLGTELGKPNAFVFGGPNSKFNIENMTYITANVISPNTDVQIDATSNKLSCTNVYYNDLDVQSIEENKTFVFGCLNAGSVKTPNIVKCIYVTDDADKSGKKDVFDDEFWYKVLYFTEY